MFKAQKTLKFPLKNSIWSFAKSLDIILTSVREWFIKISCKSAGQNFTDFEKDWSSAKSNTHTSKDRVNIKKYAMPILLFN